MSIALSLVNFGLQTHQANFQNDEITPNVSKGAGWPLTSAGIAAAAAWLVGQIEVQKAAKGNELPLNDLLIAAAAIEQGQPYSPVTCSTLK